MSYLPMPDVDLRGRESMTAYLRGHRRYHTMNSWNKSTSYAQCIKIGHLQGLSREDRDRCDEGLQCDEAFEDFNWVLRQFEENNPQWSIGANGRSGGYLVLYRREGDEVYPGRGLDMDDEDFAERDLDGLRSRVREIQAFDEACESAVAAYVDFCRRHRFVEAERMRPEKYIRAQEEEMADGR